MLSDQLVFKAVSSTPLLSSCYLCSAFAYLVFELRLQLFTMTIIKLHLLYQLGLFSYLSISLGKFSLRSRQHG